MKTDYTELDAAILAAIGAGNVTNSGIMSVCGAKYRVLDRRLQALRRVGKIAWGRSGWRITKQGDTNG